MSLRSEEEWSRLIQEQSESGKSQEDFCKERGISKNSFKRSKTRLKKRHESAFVAVTVPRAVPGSTSSKAELELPGGVIFRLSW